MLSGRFFTDKPNTNAFCNVRIESLNLHNTAILAFEETSRILFTLESIKLMAISGDFSPRGSDRYSITGPPSLFSQLMFTGIVWYSDTELSKLS